MNIQNVNTGIDAYDKSARMQPIALEHETTSTAEPVVTRNEPAHKELDQNEVKDLVNSLNEYISGINQRVSFSVDDTTQRVVVRVINRDTNEVVREIPSREAVALLEHLQDFVGMLVDEQR